MGKVKGENDVNKINNKCERTQTQEQSIGLLARPFTVPAQILQY